jgi:hypothetical protein
MSSSSPFTNQLLAAVLAGDRERQEREKQERERLNELVALLSHPQPAAENMLLSSIFGDPPTASASLGMASVSLSQALGIGPDPGRVSRLLALEPPKIRRVFFSFHYQRDIVRVQQVKKHWVVDHENHKARGYFDGSLEEKAKKEGELAVKRAINNGLFGSSVTCVLIGAETFSRRWVHYEVFKSIAQGMGVFGVRIHQLKNFQRQTDSYGTSPFDVAGYGIKRNSDKLWPMVHTAQGWVDWSLNEPVSRADAKAVREWDHPRFDEVFKVYDWVIDDGRRNFTAWVDAAAKQAGRS